MRIYFLKAQRGKCLQEFLTFENKALFTLNKLENKHALHFIKWNRKMNDTKL